MISNKRKKASCLMINIVSNSKRMEKVRTERECLSPHTFLAHIHTTHVRIGPWFPKPYSHMRKKFNKRKSLFSQLLPLRLFHWACLFSFPLFGFCSRRNNFIESFKRTIVRGKEKFRKFYISFFHRKLSPPRLKLFISRFRIMFRSLKMLLVLKRLLAT